jgi:hypothetical protein
MAKFTTTEENGEKYLLIDGKKVIKGWESFSGWYWFAVELNHIQDSIINGSLIKGDEIYFGYVQGQEGEWGYFSAGELKSLGNRVWEIPQENLHYSGRRRK